MGSCQFGRGNSDGDWCISVRLGILRPDVDHWPAQSTLIPSTHRGSISTRGVVTGTKRKLPIGIGAVLLFKDRNRCRQVTAEILLRRELLQGERLLPLGLSRPLPIAPLPGLVLLRLLTFLIVPICYLVGMALPRAPRL